MLIDRSHRRWWQGTLIAAVMLCVSYWLYATLSPAPPQGGSIPGLIYGSLALAIMLFASLLGARKKVPAWRIGRASSWLKGHLWLSLLLMPLVFFHSGFQSGGPLTVVIWVLLVAVLGSGLWGIALQQFLPRLMTEQVAMETIYDQIDHVLSQVRYETDLQMVQLVGTLGIEIKPPEGVTPAKLKEGTPQPGSELLKKFYLEKVRPSLGPAAKIESSFSSKNKITNFFDEAKLSLAPAFHPMLTLLAARMEERRQLERQKNLHHWLHGWLFFHLPVSIALLLLVIVHSISALWY